MLESAGLVERRVEGRTTVCRLSPGPLADISEWVRFYERFWNESLEKLERVFK